MPSERSTTIPVVCLMGPTASGKSALAIELSKVVPLEIVNVDVAQVYKGFDIGTAKPGKSDLDACPHHLIDVREPQHIYSAADFCGDALTLIEDIVCRGRLPFLVGGTSFYFHALLNGFPALPPSDRELRSSIMQRAQKLGWPALHRELSIKDPRRASAIEPADSQRILRALEIIEITGKAVTPLTHRQALLDRPVLKLAVCPTNRSELHRQIDKRFRMMIEKGLISEVRGLLASGQLSRELPALKMVGYRQVGEYLDGRFGYNRMVEAGIAATRQLAKRQLTWLRNQSALVWFDGSKPAQSSLLDYLRAHPSTAAISQR